MTPQASALRVVAKLFVDAVKSAGDMGVPGGVMYAAVMDKLRLDQFEEIMSGLVRSGHLSKRGDCYHFVKEVR